MKKLVKLTLVSLILVSCSGKLESYSKKPPKQISKQVKVETSEFDDSVNFIAPEINSYNFLKRGGDVTAMLVPMPTQTYYLRGWKNKKTSKLRHQIYYMDLDNNWRFYQSASDSNAKKLELVKIDRDVSCRGDSTLYSVQSICNHWETVGISLSDSYLKSKKDSGLKVKIHAKSGEDRIIEIPSNYIKGYLSKVDES